MQETDQRAIEHLFLPECDAHHNRQSSGWLVGSVLILPEPDRLFDNADALVDQPSHRCEGGYKDDLLYDRHSEMGLVWYACILTRYDKNVFRRKWIWY
ncbi:hypothetical protein D3C86_1632360 [compost metagenome]